MPPDEVLTRYDIGLLRAVQPGGGTAGSTWRIEASGGRYLLRLRGMRTSPEARLTFDHGLREHLVERGVPTVVATPTREGDRWCQHAGRVYELYPFVTGFAYDARARAQTDAAATALARYHLAARTYPAAIGWRERIGQYSALSYGAGDSDRLDDPALLVAQLQALWSLAESAADRSLLERCLVRAGALVESHAGAAYQHLASWVIHGDYTPANLLFSEQGAVVGIFDLDWAMPGSRCRDVADGLYFFGVQRAAVDAGDIWSLTQSLDWDLGAARRFLYAYESAAPLSDEERHAIPAAFVGRWLSIRLEGMAKVAAAERWRFFARDVERPLDWLDRNEEALLA